jgi:hypothetical protein
MRGKFLGIVQATSLVWLILVIVMVLTAAVYMAIPGLTTVMQERAQGITTTDTFASKVGGVIANAESVPLLSTILFVVTFILLIYSFVVWFMALEETLRLTRLKNIGVFVVLLAIMFFIMAAKDLLLVGF